MAYEPYADQTYYTTTYQGSVLSEDALPKMLLKASRNIDSLTYNRIVGRGFSNLTDFQKDIIREVCCEHAEFLYENQDELDTILSSYSINGVSATFGSGKNIHNENGVVMKSSVYALLKQSGLCCRLAR